MSDFLLSTLVVLDAIVIVYFLTYMVVNLCLLAISATRVRYSIQAVQTLRRHEERTADQRNFSPLISLLVPAYNEEVTIAESVKSLMNLRYPRYEIVIVNDGSKDDTIKVLQQAFQMVRGDIDYDPHLGTAPVRGFYRSTMKLPPSLERMVLIDKENGGKADALNVGINASRGTYLASMDADSLMIDQALNLAVQPILDDPNGVVACGGQIGLSNGCKVGDGYVEELGIPKTWVGRYQIVEYMRSFTQSRTALSHLNAILILSGVFAVFRRDLLIAIGGFLSKHSKCRIAHEYCGEGAHTVCEDMEVVVRLHRYLKEQGLTGRVVFLPYATSWTEAPEIWNHLGKQRGRWYRGLLEVLWMHRPMMMNPRYGRIGLFALPYQLLFEAMAPLFETLGYLVLPLSWAAGILSFDALLSFMAFAMAFNLLLSIGSMMVAITRVRSDRAGEEEALMGYTGLKTLLVLVFAGLISNIGYRQYLLAWQLKGLKDWLKGHQGWDKFARAGFQKA